MSNNIFLLLFKSHIQNMLQLIISIIILKLQHIKIKLSSKLFVIDSTYFLSIKIKVV